MKYTRIYPKDKNNKITNAFQRSSVVYCAKCSRRGNWKEVNTKWLYLAGDTLDLNRVPMYGFACHNDTFVMDAKIFNETHRINGPAHKSYIVFENEDED